MKTTSAPAIPVAPDKTKATAKTTAGRQALAAESAATGALTSKTGKAAKPTPAKTNAKAQPKAKMASATGPRSAPPAKAAKAAPGKPKSPAKGKSTAGSPALLVIRYDAGWSNTLFIRGEGAGLSWETGTPLACIGDNEWIWSPRLTSPILVKVLINDTHWATGANLVLVPGETLTVTPSF